MGVQTELTRISGAKTDLKAAIRGKGVAVAESAKIDAYPALVQAITQGVVDVATADELSAKAAEANLGRCYRFTGVTDGTYTTNNIYVVGESGMSIQLIPYKPEGPNEISKEVNFLDYDGTILYSYTAADFATLSSMPANPTHDGLTAQGWNWSLTNAKAYVAKYGKLNIGQMYITDDGKTRIYIHLEEGRTSPVLGVCPNGTVDIDWGDGTVHDTLTGSNTSTAVYTSAHSYAAPGDYVIQLTVTGSMGFNSDGLLTYTSVSDDRGYVYKNAIRKVELGSGVTSIGSSTFSSCYSLSSITIPDGVTSIGGNAFDSCSSLSSITIPDSVTSIGSGVFNYCSSLSSITIPDGVTSIGSGVFIYCSSLSSIIIPDSVTSIGGYAFYYCSSLSSITIPDGVTSIGGNAFDSCYSLSSITIPDGVTSIGDGAFYSCYSLSSITIPDSVTSIGSGVFNYCYGVAHLYFLSTTPPSVSNSDAFSDIPTDCVIHVPVGSLSAYTSATNYPSSSTYTYVEDIV